MLSRAAANGDDIQQTSRGDRSQERAVSHLTGVLRGLLQTTSTPLYSNCVLYRVGLQMLGSSSYFLQQIWMDPETSVMWMHSLRMIHPSCKIC